MLGLNLQQQNADFQRLADSVTRSASKCLALMFDKSSRLFSSAHTRRESGPNGEKVSSRDTLIALIGIHNLDETGAHSIVETTESLAAIMDNGDWVQGINDIGLLLWACAIISPESFVQVTKRWDLRLAFSRYSDARIGDTAALSVFLTGLSCLAIALPDTSRTTRELAFDAYRRIRMNQGSSGFFGHCSVTSSLWGRIAGEIGTFEDQAYATYAITKFSEAYGNHRAVETALDCALAICDAQGQLGQWWWRYDAPNGRIVTRFPVLSVHQYGLGPMALLALGEAIGSDFTPWVYKGLQWLEDNELRMDMMDESGQLISKGIRRTGSRKIWNGIVNVATGREDREACTGLELLPECRPRDLGWLLYALAPVRKRLPHQCTRALTTAPEFGRGSVGQ